MNIRYGKMDDAKMISELGARTFHETFSRDNTPENIAAYLERSFSIEIQSAELSDPDTLFLIAEMDGRPVGYVKLNLNRGRDSSMNPKAMEIERIYTLQELIGKGVGRELMKACINEAKQRELEVIWLGVWENNRRAINFYEKWGFETVGEHTFQLGDEAQKDYIMELRL